MRTLLSLFDFSGVWASAFEAFGWSVVCVDLKRGDDIGAWSARSLMRDLLQAFPVIDGLISAVPCTAFAKSGAQFWRAKDADGRTAAAVHLVHQTLRVVDFVKPDFWALENPEGRLPRLVPELGEAVLAFDPFDFAGHTTSADDAHALDELRGREVTAADVALVKRTGAYTKRTLLWGCFVPPARRPVPPVRCSSQGSWLQRLGGAGESTKAARSDPARVRQGLRACAAHRVSGKASLDRHPPAGAARAARKDRHMTDTRRAPWCWDLVFIGCAKSKRAEQAHARDLYTGPVFAAHLAIVQHLGLHFDVLSAKHGPVGEHDVVEPYDQQVGDGLHTIPGPTPFQTARDRKRGQMPIAPRERWCDAVLRVVLEMAADRMLRRDSIALTVDPAYQIPDIKVRFDALASARSPWAFGPPTQPAVLVLAGAPYIDGWASRARALGVRVDDPLRGYTLGDRRVFARRFIAETTAWSVGEDPSERGYTRDEQLLSFVDEFELERAPTIDDIDVEQQPAQVGFDFWGMEAAP